jgi:nucleotide-binding universal stress UspA family protein
MRSLAPILVATDFSPHARHAADVAVAFAEKLGAEVMLVHALSLPALAYAAGLSWPVAELEQDAGKALDEAASVLKGRCPKVNVSLRFGPPAEEILAAAREHDSGLVVMGTHGRQGLSRLLLGSVAERVVRASPVPVLTVPLA